VASFAAPDAPGGAADGNLVVRRAGLDDAPALAAVARRAFREAYAAVTRPADLERHLAASFGDGCQAAELADPEVAAWLALAGGAPIGYAMLRRGPAPPCVPGPRPMQLWRCYVLEAWHGWGVAGRLMHAAVAEATRRGAGTLWLSVWERNARALAFYRKSGFEEVGDAIFKVGDDRQRDRVMARQLETLVALSGRTG
jgi:diamine N-acetyltransferase